MFTIIYLLVSQNVPVKPVWQVHVNVLIPSLHTPLLRHGLTAQSFISVGTRKVKCKTLCKTYVTFTLTVDWTVMDNLVLKLSELVSSFLHLGQG